MFQRILVPVDGSPTSQRAMAKALQMATAFGAQLRLVHVVEEAAYLAGYDPIGGTAGSMLSIMQESGRKILAEAKAAAAESGVQAECVLFDRLGERLGDTVAREATSWDADLVVVGTHGRRGIGRLLMGSGAEQIIRLATVPVLVVRSEDRE